MNMEKVMVVKSVAVEHLLNRPFNSETVEAVRAIALAEPTYVGRDTVETDPSYKQVIPYVVVLNTDSDKYLLLQRTSKQQEARLHGKMSLGVGGHIDQETPLRFSPDIIEASLHRELDEEVMLRCYHNLEPLGVLYTDSTEVGRVHVGLAYLLSTDSSEFKVGEPDNMTAKWADAEEIAGVYDRLEQWSQVVFDQVIRGNTKLSTTVPGESK